MEETKTQLEMLTEADEFAEEYWAGDPDLDITDDGKMSESNTNKFTTHQSNFDLLCKEVTGNEAVKNVSMSDGYIAFSMNDKKYAVSVEEVS